MSEAKIKLDQKLMDLMSLIDVTKLTEEQKAKLAEMESIKKESERLARLEHQKVVLADKLNSIMSEYFKDIEILDYKNVMIEYSYGKQSDSLVLRKIVFLDELDESHKIDVYVNVLFNEVKSGDGSIKTETKYQKIYTALPFTPSDKLIQIANAVNDEKTSDEIKDWFSQVIDDYDMSLIQEYKDIQELINIFISRHSKITMPGKYDLDAVVNIFVNITDEGQNWEFDVNVNGVKKQLSGERGSRVKLNGYKNLRGYALETFINPGCAYPSKVIRELYEKNGFNSQWNLSQHVSKHELSIPIEKRLYRQAKGLDK